MQRNPFVLSGTILVAFFAGAHPSFGQPKPVSYQGVLNDAGNLANGCYEVCFQLYNTSDCGTGTAYNSAECISTTVVDGLLSTQFLVDSADLPDDPGEYVYLEIRIRRCGQPAYVPICPRQEITSSPLTLRTDIAREANRAIVASTIDLPNVFALSSSSPLITLTQTGAGEAIRVGGTSTFTGTAAFTGATPLSVTSSALIPNLNAQLLNGRNESFLRSASNLNAGTLPDLRLSTNVALLAATQTFAGVNTFSHASNSFTGNGATLTNLNAANLATGTLPSPRFTGTYSGAVTLSNASNSFAGNGATLTNLNASNLATGTLQSARFAGTYSGAVTLSNAANSFAGNGATLTNLNASSLATGTLQSGRLSGSYTSAVTFSNASNVYSGSGANLTSLNAASINLGTLNDARLTSNIARRGGGPGEPPPSDWFIGRHYFRSTSGLSFVEIGDDSDTISVQNETDSNDCISVQAGGTNGVAINASAIGTNGVAIRAGGKVDVTGNMYVGGMVGINTPSPTVPLHITWSNAGLARFDRFGSDGDLVGFARDGTTRGSITVSGNTVSYNAFTGSHLALMDEPAERGMLITMTGSNVGQPGHDESVYGAALTRIANDPACLGAYLSPVEPTKPVNLDNPHQIMSVGNGEVWVVDTGTDVRPGDLLISSNVPGCAMRDDSSQFPVGYIVARAAGPIHWADVAVEGADSVRRSLVSVLFDRFVRSGDPADVSIRMSALEQKNTCDGVVTLDDHGGAVVRLPDSFEALNRDFRYQLTCIGGFAPVYIAEEIRDGRFTIAGGRAGLKVSWMVTGVRHDACAQAHPLIVEQDKEQKDVGRYVTPEAFGMPRSARILAEDERPSEDQP